MLEDTLKYKTPLQVLNIQLEWEDSVQAQEEFDRQGTSSQSRNGAAAASDNARNPESSRANTTNPCVWLEQLDVAMIDLETGATSKGEKRKHNSRTHKKSKKRSRETVKRKDRDLEKDEPKEKKVRFDKKTPKESQKEDKLDNVDSNFLLH